MAPAGDTPLVRNVPGRGLPRQVRVALDAGRTVVLLSKRDTDLNRTLREVAAPAVVASGRLGDGRTATLLRTGAVPEAWAYWPRAVPEPVWRWSCRACGAVDERWSWGEVDEDAPMVRQAYVLKVGELVEVPWACPRSPACHGAPRWHRSLP